MEQAIATSREGLEDQQGESANQSGSGDYIAGRVAIHFQTKPRQPTLTIASTPSQDCDALWKWLSGYAPKCIEASNLHQSGAVDSLTLAQVTGAGFPLVPP